MCRQHLQGQEFDPFQRLVWIVVPPDRDGDHLQARRVDLHHHLIDLEANQISGSGGDALAHCLAQVNVKQRRISVDVVHAHAEERTTGLDSLFFQLLAQQCTRYRVGEDGYTDDDGQHADRAKQRADSQPQVVPEPPNHDSQR